MTCVKCGSEWLFQFVVSQTPSPPAAEDLPLVCQACGVIMISGKVIDLPEVLARPIRELAEQAKGWGKKAREDLEEMARADPDARVEGYMANYYKTAYHEGFFRALMFFQHIAKEGRLRRLRALWRGGIVASQLGEDHPDRPERKGVLMNVEAYTEFEQLLNPSAVPGESDAPSSAYKRSSEQEDQSQLPRQ